MFRKLVPLVAALVLACATSAQASTPTVSFTSPTADQAVTVGSQLPITVAASGSDNGVNRCQVDWRLWSGGTWAKVETPARSDYSAPYEWSFTVPSFADGTKLQLRATCYDNSATKLTGRKYVNVVVGQATDPAPDPDPTPDPTPTSGEGPAAHGFYGLGWQGDGLANLELGRSNRSVAYRFKAEKDGALSGVRVYFVTGSGYSSGNGGDIHVELRNDGGGVPGSTVLGTGGVNDPLSPTFRTVPLSGKVTAGQVYYLVFSNTDPNSGTNWVSLDDLWHSQSFTPVQEVIADSDLGALYRDGTGSWTFNRGHTPIFTLAYQDGSQHGPGAPYVNGRSQSGLHTVGGSSKVAEQFTVSGGDKTVNGAAFRVRRTSGTGALTLRLETSSGGLVASGSVNASSTSYRYAHVTFPSVTLQNGTSYRLVAQAPSGTSYQTFPLTQGSGFQSPWQFTDGAMQVSSGGSWSTPSGADDAQFYLDLAGA